MSRDPQLEAADPKISAFVTANAGAGKTYTLVRRVARLLLAGAEPDTILCLTYTKAAAAEMQSRLFDLLGAWAVMNDADLAGQLEELEEPDRDLSIARRLFARALETPGGLKIQTIHAFCEKLLKRFPLEAGVSPNFTVLDDVAAAAISRTAREDLARFAAGDPDGVLAEAYARMAVQLDQRAFENLFGEFENRRLRLKAYIEASLEGPDADVWSKCGFDGPAPSEPMSSDAVEAIDWRRWTLATEALEGGGVTDRKLAAKMRATAQGAPFDAVWAIFSTGKGEPLKKIGSQAVDGFWRNWLEAERDRLCEACKQIRAARTAEDTLRVLRLANGYVRLYEGAKAAAGGLDFGDLIAAVRDLLLTREDAAWVLYKLDGGINHILVDEAQDTAPDQWAVIDALSAEFFAAEPQARTAFAVGDEKQSIYSFQGAAPEQFLAEATRYRAMVEGAGQDFREPRLLTSRRSTPEVLGFVDAVFRDPQALAGLKPAAEARDTVEHKAHRDPGFGAVDLWPNVVGEPAEETDPWDPVDKEGPKSANKLLAARIAAEIKRMVEAREAVAAKDGELRPAVYGDFMILVRRRGALFHEIIRALKQADVAVGGADRLLLSEHIVFADLIGLARFCLYPGDELSLAALLRSPFCSVDEDNLMKLALDRQQPLWAELSSRADKQADWAEARAFFDWALAEHQRRPPFDFFSRVLARRAPDGRSYRRRMLTRLGREAEDALDAFLTEALKAEQRGVRDLERFVAAMAGTEIEVKRELEDKSGPGGGEVRVMTVHGAKGLEAPIVILPDTTTKAADRGGPLLGTRDGGFVWAPRKAEDFDWTAEARSLREAASDAESLRLLYVALTRARDRLIVCGVEPKKKSEGSWRDIIGRALGDPAIREAARMVPGAGDTQIVRFGADPVVAPAGSLSGDSAERPPPPWLDSAPPTEPPMMAYRSPSSLADNIRAPSPSPLSAVGGLGRFRRGDLIHRLLQLLPDLPLERREAAAARLLAREPDLTPEQRDDMAAAALAVLNDPKFAPVFAPGSRAEAAVAGTAGRLPQGLAISGRMDRLVIADDRVLVVDYKTNRPAPACIEEADPAYILQMAAYAAVLAEVFPGRRIEAALIWTDGPKLMPIPEIMLQAALANLASAA